MSVLTNTVSEKLIILDLLKSHFLVSINDNNRLMDSTCCLLGARWWIQFCVTTKQNEDGHCSENYEFRERFERLGFERVREKI